MATVLIISEGNAARVCLVSIPGGGKNMLCVKSRETGEEAVTLEEIAEVVSIVKPADRDPFFMPLISEPYPMHNADKEPSAVKSPAYSYRRKKRPWESPIFMGGRKRN